MQTLRPSQVPEYLRNSKFFLGLNAADDDEFSIPLNHMKPNTNVDSFADITELLNTIRFWGLDAFPQTVIDFAALHRRADIISVLEPYKADLPFICGACYILLEDIHGELRLEKAMDTGNIDVVQYFHKPGAQFTFRAILLAAGRGALDCLQYALSATTEGHYSRRTGNAVFIEAVRNGRMGSILLLQRFGFPLRLTESNYVRRVHDFNLCGIAALSGHFEVLKYLHGQGCDIQDTASNAADAGHWECFEYAINNGAPFRSQSFNWAKSGTLAQWLERDNKLKLLVLAWSCASETEAAMVATSENWQHFVASVHRETRPSINLIAAAVESGNLACLRHLYQVCAAKAVASGQSWNWLTYAASVSTGKLRFVDVIHSAASAKRWECLRFLIQHGCLMNKSLTTALVHADQLELYHLAVAHGCEVSVQAACKFTRDGNINLLQHAMEHGCERSEEILRTAARHGQLQCLKYAHAQGCPWSLQVTLAAARGGHGECLQYLYEQVCPSNEYVRSILGKRSIPV